MKRNAAIYARVSSDRQREQNTIASQTTLLLEYATAHDCVVPQEWIFQDDGYSGSVLARPGLERLRDLVAEGFIETLLVYAPDWLSRKYAYQVLLLEEFSRCGAETVFLKSAGGDSPEERLLVQFQGMIAEYERAQIAERTRRGKRHRAKTGCVNVLFRSTVWLSICQEKRCGRSLLCGDRGGSRSGPRGFRALYQRTLEHRSNWASPQPAGRFDSIQ